jgi:hypothetical protein
MDKARTAFAMSRLVTAILLISRSFEFEGARPDLLAAVKALGGANQCRYSNKS